MSNKPKHFPKKGRIYIPELFEAIGKVRSKKERVEILHEYARRDEPHCKTLRAVIECIFHPAVVFKLPEGTPPYNKGEYPDFNFANSDLFKEVRRVKYFCDCPAMIKNQIKREAVFIQTLEALHPKEAEVFIAMKEKTLPKYRGVTEALFREAFPAWMPPEEEKAKKGE